MTKVANTFIASWPLLLLVPFSAVFFPPNAIVGYKWRGELALAAFLLAVILFVALDNRPWLLRRLSKPEMALIVLPTVLLTVWSGLSCFWASSSRGAMHHTLLWGCYAIFYVLIRSAIDDKTIRLYMFAIVRYVVLIISAVCVVEFVASREIGYFTFWTRYYPFAEINISLLPLLVALAIDNTARESVRGLLFNLLTWCSVMVTASRTMFIAGTTSILMLTGLSIMTYKRLVNLKRWLGFIGLAIVITLGSQLLLKADVKRGLFNRLGGSEQTSVKDAESRLLFWALAIEGFKASPLTGIGGDNYFTEYKLIRERYSVANPENPLLEINEDSVPERAHNEYLQILSELGIVGTLLFGWMLAGIAYMFFLAVRKRASLATLGALAGITAFLISSGASSYSFRVPANGLCFFFLIAVAAAELFKPPSDDPSDDEAGRWKPLFLAAALLVAISMLGFSAVRALSIHHMTNSLNTDDTEYAEAQIKKALAWDASEPMFRFYYGQQLYLSGRYEEGIHELRLAIESGLATSPSYFNLLAAEMLAGMSDDAKKTFDEALRVYPRSVFLRTAYAAFLKRQGDPSAADIEYKRAFEINPKQARSWQLAHDEGLERLSIVANTDADYIKPMDLIPADGALALVSFQR